MVVFLAVILSDSTQALIEYKVGAIHIGHVAEHGSLERDMTSACSAYGQFRMS